MDDDLINAMFEAANGEFLKFDRIPEAAKRHRRPDVCAFLYLDALQPGGTDIVAAAEHDEIYLGFDLDGHTMLNEEDVVYLSRCGVRYDSDNNSLCMFV